MKKLLLASAVAALSVSSAYAAADVYGRVAADLRYQEDGDVTLDGGSRLGVKGSKVLTPSVNGIYQVEWSAHLDNDGKDGDGKVANFKSRDTYIGVQGDSFGTIKAGYLSSIDGNANYAGYSDYWNAGLQGASDSRVKNALAYISPNYNGMTFMAMYKLTDADKGAKGGKDGAGTMGVAATYENGPMRVGAAYIDLKDSKNEKNRMLVSGEYDITSQISVSGLYQLADFDTDDNENSYIIAGSYKIPNTNWGTYVEYDAVTNKGGVKDADVDVISLGGTYDFGNGMSGRIFAGMADDGDNDKFGVGTGLTYKF